MNRLLLTIFIALIACASAGAQTKTDTLGAAPKAGAAEAGSNGPTTQEAAARISAKPETSTAASLNQNPKESCACELALPEVLATVNGEKITIKEIDTTQNRLEGQVHDIEDKVINARRRELDLQINSRLLKMEAKKRGITTTRLIETEVIAKVKEPTEAEAQAFYDQNKSRIKGEFKDVKADITAYLMDKRQQDEAQVLAQKLRAAPGVKLLVENATAPVMAADRARLFAILGDERITSGDIEESLRPLIYQVQKQIYAKRYAALEVKINDILLQNEAQKRKTTTKELLHTEVIAKVPAVTEADAQAFYNENKGRIEGGDFPQVKAQIIQYLQELATRKVELAFAKQLRDRVNVQICLAPPVPPVYSIATHDQPTKGGKSAAVTLVEFTDFQCPTCARMQPVIERLLSEYGERVRLVIRDFPLSQHTHAFKAAEAAEAAREQGKYWEYTSLLLSNQKGLDVDRLKTYASQLGLDRQRFDGALESGKFRGRIESDIEDGVRVGLNGTPSVFANGIPVEDLSYEGLKARIESALQTTAGK